MVFCNEYDLQKGSGTKDRKTGRQWGVRTPDKQRKQESRALKSAQELSIESAVLYARRKMAACYGSSKCGSKASASARQNGSGRDERFATLLS